jgi:phosphinothricin acetyltransferase
MKSEGIVRISEMTAEDYAPVAEIFNYYIQHSDAAFLENPVGEDFFSHAATVLNGYPLVTLKNDAGILVGFGMLRPHNPLPAFRHTAEVGYFIRNDLTGSGHGTRILDHLAREAGRRGISSILAPVSSRNEGSLRFHQRRGFREVGRFSASG